MPSLTKLSCVPIYEPLTKPPPCIITNTGSFSSLLFAGVVTLRYRQSSLMGTTVTQGEIEGVEHEGAALYKKIPYAEAPVGNLRWKAPVPKKPWEGVYKSDSWGNRPPQHTDPNQSGGDIPMSEDCLYLSVTTPAKSKSRHDG